MSPISPEHRDREPAARGVSSVPRFRQVVRRDLLALVVTIGLATLLTSQLAMLVPGADHLGPALAIVVVIVALLPVAGWRAGRLAKRLSRPIEWLAAESARVVGRGADADAPPRGPDPTMAHGTVHEVRMLARSHARLRRELLARRRMERGVAAARTVQAATLPDRLPSIPGLRVAASAEAAEETGGDVYDVLPVHASVGAWRAEQVFMLVADATGHGFGPAIIAMQLRGMLRMGVAAGLDLECMIRAVDRQLAEDLPGAHYVTAWLARYDPRTRELEWVSAGQGPLLHHDAASGVTDLLEADRPPLGIGWTGPFRSRRTHIGPGDAFVVLTDGFHESMNVRGELWGFDALRDLVDRSVHHGAGGMLEQLQHAVDRHAAGRLPMDDRTALVIVGDRGDDAGHVAEPSVALRLHPAASAAE